MPLGKEIHLKAETKATTFGARIRQLRKAIGLTQRELAERVSSRLRKDDGRGFDFTYLSKIEKEKLPAPSTPAIVQLAGVLKADAEELLALAGRPPLGLGEALTKKPSARAFFSWAINRLTEREWQELLAQMKKKSGDQSE